MSRVITYTDDGHDAPTITRIGVVSGEDDSIPAGEHVCAACGSRSNLSAVTTPSGRRRFACPNCRPEDAA